MRVHRYNFTPTVEQNNDACRPGRPCAADTEPRFEFWSNYYRKQFAVPGVITPDAEAMRSRLLEEMEWRISDAKKQFSSIPLLLGAELHRYYKQLIFDPSETLWTPLQKAAAVLELNNLLAKLDAADDQAQAR